MAPQAFDPQPVAPQDFGAPSVAPAGVDPTWGAPAPLDPTWGAPVPEAAPVAEAPMAEAVPVSEAAPVSETTGPAPLVYTGSIPPPVSVPVFPGAGVPSAEVPTAEPVPVPSGETADDVQGDAPSAKRFLGMQLRRPRRGDVLDENVGEAGPSAPVAAWPTDVGVAVVATAEPAAPVSWGPPAEAGRAVGYAGPRPRAGSAAVDARRNPLDLVPVEAPP